MGKISTQCYHGVQTAFTLSLPVYAGTDLISVLSFLTDSCSVLYEVLATNFDVLPPLCWHMEVLGGGFPAFKTFYMWKCMEVPKRTDLVPHYVATAVNESIQLIIII